MPKPQEVATLIVRGNKFEDWESVWVHERWCESFSHFRFTAAERDTIFTDKVADPQWYRLQFKPGDQCTIQLAGITVITGFIEVRQVAYDANNHGVQLSGKSITAYPARSSVDTKTGSFDGMNVEQAARKVLSQYPVGVKVIGKLDNTPFDKLQNQPGELIWDFLERIARPRGIIMGSDSLGNFQLIGDHTMPIVTDLIEGVNIKTCQAVMSHEKLYSTLKVTGQTAASDGNSGKAASEQEASVGSVVPGQPKSLLITPSEQPVKSITELMSRAQNEALWHDGTLIQVNITVQGWLRDGKTLWRPGDNVFVKSPMAMLNMPMKIQEIQFTQDNQQGTQTNLLLVPPWALKDGTNWNPSDPSLPKKTAYVAPTEAQSLTSVA